MIVNEFVHAFSFVARPAVNKQSNLVKTPDDLFAMLNELLLFFSLEKSVNQRPLRTSGKHVRILPLEVYGRRGAAPFGSPASRDVGKKSK